MSIGLKRRGSVGRRERYRREKTRLKRRTCLRKWASSFRSSFLFMEATREPGKQKQKKKKIVQALNNRDHIVLLITFIQFLLCSQKEQPRTKGLGQRIYANIGTKDFGTYSIALTVSFPCKLWARECCKICRAARRRATSYFSSGAKRSPTTSLQHCNADVKEEEKKTKLGDDCYKLFKEKLGNPTHKASWRQNAMGSTMKANTLKLGEKNFHHKSLM